MNSLLADARKVSRKVRKSNQQAIFDDYTNRIQKRILKVAANGETSYRFCKVPNRQEYLADGDCGKAMFVRIAKHFSELGFQVSYNKKEGKKLEPTWAATMNILWD